MKPQLARLGDPENDLEGGWTCCQLCGRRLPRPQDFLTCPSCDVLFDKVPPLSIEKRSAGDLVTAPRKVVSGPDWVRAHSGDRLVEVEAAHSLRLTMPTALEDDATFAARSGRYREFATFGLPPAFVMTVRDGRMWGPLGTLITPDNSVIAETATIHREHDSIPILSHDTLVRPQHLVGTAAALTTRGANGNYCHWVLELLPRFGLLRRGGFDLRDIDWFIVNRYSEPFQVESLAALEIDPHKIVTSSEVSHLSADRMIGFSHNFLHSLASQWQIDFLRTTFLKGAPLSGRKTRLYANRSDVRVRRLENEPELEEMLRELGFITFSARDHSFADQVRAFAEAGVIVAPHGAALTNVVFSDKGSTLVEIMPPSPVKPSTWGFASVVGLRYICVHGEEDDRAAESPAVAAEDDFRVDLNRVRRALDVAGVR